VTERRGKRHRLQVLYEVLVLCRGRGAFQSYVMLRCNLNTAAFRRFTGELVAAGLLGVSVVDGREWFVTSSAGREFVARFEALTQMVTDGLYVHKS